jgi:hypothetical protein
MEDFPSLNRSQIQSARIYARRFPSLGKQFPSKSLKRMLRRSGFSRISHELAELRRDRRGVSAR